MKAGRADQVAGLVMPLLLDQPALFDALQLLGLSRFRQGRTADGEWLLSAAAGLAPEQGWVWTNLVAGLADCGARQRAFEVALRARRHHPEMPALLRQIATLGITLGNYPAVEEVCAGRAGQDPYLAYCLSNVRLRRGDWRSGFALYEARWEAHGKQRFSPEWNGRADQGEGLVIYDEQGLGDAIQFVRYLPALRRLYRGRLILRVLDPLVELFAGQADEVVSRKATAFANCASFPLMSLPHLLISRGEKSPVTGAPYLRPDPELARQAGARLGERAGRRRVGLAWQGLTRSLPFEAFAPLLDLPGVQWVSLQFKDQAGDPRLLQVMGDGRFDRTAAMVANLDLVITIDSSLAHLGGALGVPTWVLLDHAACWRWMESGGTTPWYDSVTVYRQDQPGDWRPVIEAVRRDLSPLTAS